MKSEHLIFRSAITTGLNLLDEQVYQVKQIDLVPLLITRVGHIQINVQIRLLEDQLDKHAFFLHELLMQGLQLEFLLTLLLLALVVYFFDLIDERLHVLLVLVDLILLLA